jgi:hypothetical protein
MHARHASFSWPHERPTAARLPAHLLLTGTSTCRCRAAPPPQVASELLATTERLISRYSSAMGDVCLGCPPPTDLQGAESMLRRGGSGSRSVGSIRQALASYQQRLSDDPMLTDDDTPGGTPSSGPAAGSLAAAAQAPEAWQRSACPAARGQLPGGGGSCDGCGESRAPAGAAAAAAPAPCSMIEQLQSALSLWEELKANARTPSTVLPTPFGPQLAACSSSAVLQCS